MAGNQLRLSWLQPVLSPPCSSPARPHMLCWNPGSAASMQTVHMAFAACLTLNCNTGILPPSPQPRPLTQASPLVAERCHSYPEWSVRAAYTLCPIVFLLMEGRLYHSGLCCVELFCQAVGFTGSNHPPTATFSSHPSSVLLGRPFLQWCFLLLLLVHTPE